MPTITEPRIGADPEIGVSDAVPGEDGTIRQHGELRRGTAAVGRCAAGGPAINVKVIPAAVGTQKPGGAIARGYGGEQLPPAAETVGRTNPVIDPAVGVLHQHSAVIGLADACGCPGQCGRELAGQLVIDR